MKVLMFGWEFPPHISGGLGTACFGLTQSLMNLKIKVLFVVPRMFEEHSGSQDFLINASALRKESRVSKRKSAKEKHISVTSAGHLGDGAVRSSSSSLFTYVEVNSLIKPYGAVEERSIKRQHDLPITMWNYVFRNKSSVHEQLISAWWDEVTVTAENAGDPYVFTGTYGTNLMEEVKRYAAVASRIAGHYRFDVVHAHDWMTFPAGIAASQKSKKPLVVHVHSTEFDRSGDNVNETIYNIERLGMERAERVITVSNWTKRIVVSRYGIPEEKIKVIHNGVLPKEQPAAFDFPPIGSHFVTFLGRVTHQKGPGYFVEAAQLVLQEFPEAHFIVAGAGDLLPQIIERVAQLNMSANFHFTGFLAGAQVDHIWSITDVYVMPSVSEPFGIAPLEAIQGNVPVILSNQSGVAEVMPHAIKVDFWDVKALAAAICSVLRYESLSHVLRQNSRKHIEQLTWEKAASEVKDLYHEFDRKK